MTPCRRARARERLAHAFAMMFPLWYPERFACVMAYTRG